MKTSKKMLQSISKLEKKYGNLDKTFGSENTPYRKGYFCFCTLRSPILKYLAYTVLVNGEIHNI
jgi:hypothetical protein